MNHLVRAVIYKYFVSIIRAYPLDFFIGHLMSVFFSLLFSTMLYRGLFQEQVSDSFVQLSGTGDYLAYVVVGLFMYGFTVNTLLNVSRTLITERRIGTLESLFLAPYNRVVYFLSTMFAQTIHNAWELILAIPIIFFFKISFHSFDVMAFIVVFIMILYSFLGMSLLLANLMLYTGDTYISQNTLFSIIFLVCGITFPKEYLPLFLQKLALLLPITYGTEMMRAVMLKGGELKELGTGLLWLFLEGTVYCLLGFYFMGKVEKIAIERIEG